MRAMCVKAGFILRQIPLHLIEAHNIVTSGADNI
jgi:hypothetical protein